MGLLRIKPNTSKEEHRVRETTRADLSDASWTMVSIDHVAHKLLTYIPYVLVLIDMRYEGKKRTILLLLVRVAHRRHR